LYGGYLLEVLRIPLLSDELANAIRGNGFRAPVQEADLGAFARAVLDLGDDGGYRNRSHRQQRPPPEDG
jgi:hypothetical protein